MYFEKMPRKRPGPYDSGPHATFSCLVWPTIMAGLKKKKAKTTWSMKSGVENENSASLSTLVWFNDVCEKKCLQKRSILGTRDCFWVFVPMQSFFPSISMSKAVEYKTIWNRKWLPVFTQPLIRSLEKRKCWRSQLHFWKCEIPRLSRACWSTSFDVSVAEKDQLVNLDLKVRWSTNVENWVIGDRKYFKAPLLYLSFSMTYWPLWIRFFSFASANSTFFEQDIATSRQLCEILEFEKDMEWVKGDEALLRGPQGYFSRCLP